MADCEPKSKKSKKKTIGTNPNCARMFLLLFNGLVMIGGFIAIILGGYFLVSTVLTDRIVGRDSDVSPPFLILVGIILISLAFFCTYGMFFQNLHVIVMFLGMIMVMVALMLAMGTVAAVREPNSETIIRTHMALVFDAVLRLEMPTPKTRDYHIMQREQKCCGLETPQDYDRMVREFYPSSCCNRAQCKREMAHKVGCLPLTLDRFKGLIFCYWVFLVGLSIICLIDALFALCVATYIWKFRPEQGFSISFRV